MTRRSRRWNTTPSVLVARRPWVDGQHVGHGQRPDIMGWVESGPPLRGSSHPHVRVLNLAAGEASFDGQVKTGERESRANRGSRLTNMLGAIGIDQVLVDECRITVGERVVGKLMHQGATLAGGVRLWIRFEAKAGTLQAASRTNDLHGR